MLIDLISNRQNFKAFEKEIPIAETYSSESYCKYNNISNDIS